MSDDNKPTNLRELLALNSGKDIGTARAIANSDTARFGNFDYDTKSYSPEITTKDINAKGQIGVVFKNGNYHIEGAHADILAGAEAFGNEILQAASKFGVKVTDLTEFKDKGIDYNKDGKLDAREIGFTILAASMKNEKAQIMSDDISRKLETGDILSTFDNQISAADMKSLLDPRTAHIAKEIAKQLLVDNGLVPNNNDNSVEANTQFVKSVKDDMPNARC